MEFICCCCQILEAHWGTQGSWKHIRRKTWSVKYKINKSIYQLHYSIWNFCNLLLKFVRGHCRRKHQRKYLNIPSDMFCKSSVLVCVLECFVICHLTCLLIIKKKKTSFLCLPRKAEHSPCIVPVFWPCVVKKQRTSGFASNWIRADNSTNK